MAVFYTHFFLFFFCLFLFYFFSDLFVHLFIIIKCYCFKLRLIQKKKRKNKISGMPLAQSDKLLKKTKPNTECIHIRLNFFSVFFIYFFFILFFHSVFRFIRLHQLSTSSFSWLILFSFIFCFFLLLFYFIRHSFGFLVFSLDFHFHSIPFAMRNV